MHVQVYSTVRYKVDRCIEIYVHKLNTAISWSELYTRLKLKPPSPPITIGLQQSTNSFINWMVYFFTAYFRCMYVERLTALLSCFLQF